MYKKIETALWFLKNPAHIPHIFQIFKRRKYAALEDTREESTKWCIANTLSYTKAFEKLGISTTFEELSDLFPESIKNAKQIELDCPVKMGGEGAISFLYHVSKSFEVKKVIESGVAFGWSTLSLLLAIKDKEDALLISNDMPYIKMNNEDYVGCIIPKELRNNWELQRLPDINGIPLALKKLKNTIDLFHYDSDKTYTGRIWSSPLIWKALKVGGFFISDDINDNLAFKHFAESVEREPIIIEHNDKYVGVLVK